MNYELPLEKVYHLSEWLFNLIMINVLWLIFNLPILYFSTHLLIAKDFHSLISILIIMIFLAPFIFFPATQTMFILVRRLIFDQGRSRRIIRSFLKKYLKNYISNMFKGILLIFIWIIFIVDYYFFTTKISNLFTYVFLFLLIILLMFSLNFFSVSVHFESTLYQELKNAFLVTLANPLLTIGVGALNVLLVYLSFNYLTFLIPLIMGSLISLISFACVYQLIFKNITSENI